MSQSKLDTNRVVRLLLQDSVPTLGERARAEVLRLAASYKALAQEWIDDGLSVADAQRSIDQYFVDALQQTAHDLFWDTTWPACRCIHATRSGTRWIRMRGGATRTRRQSPRSARSPTSVRLPPNDR